LTPNTDLSLLTAHGSALRCGGIAAAIHGGAQVHKARGRKQAVSRSRKNLRKTAQPSSLIIPDGQSE